MEDTCQSCVWEYNCRTAVINCFLFLISVCEYYAHLECQDFVVSDCKECATYGPQKDLVSSQYIEDLIHV